MPWLAMWARLLAVWSPSAFVEDEQGCEDAGFSQQPHEQWSPDTLQAHLRQSPTDAARSVQAAGIFRLARRNFV